MSATSPVAEVLVDHLGREVAGGDAPPGGVVGRADGERPADGDEAVGQRLGLDGQAGDAGRVGHSGLHAAATDVDDDVTAGLVLVPDRRGQRRLGVAAADRQDPDVGLGEERLAVGGRHGELAHAPRPTAEAGGPIPHRP